MPCNTLVIVQRLGDSDVLFFASLSLLAAAAVRNGLFFCFISVGPAFLLVSKLTVHRHAEGHPGTLHLSGNLSAGGNIGVLIPASAAGAKEKPSLMTGFDCQLKVSKVPVRDM